jgi:lysozyme family protein
MADFQTCFEWMLDNEDARRAYAQVHDAPPGAFAISGINSAAFPSDFAAIEAIPQAQRGPSIKRFYQLRFWNTWFTQLLSDDVAKRVFDEAVNAGAGTAVRVLQTATNALGGALTVDGGWGTLTLAAANAANPTALYQAFIEARKDRYREIVRNNPADEKYLEEWLARANK